MPISYISLNAQNLTGKMCGNLFIYSKRYSQHPERQKGTPYDQWVYKICVTQGTFWALYATTKNAKTKS